MSKVQSDKAVVSRAIRSTKNPTGSPFADIKKYLLAKYPDMTIADAKNLKVYLKDAVKSGEILKVDGKYQINAKPKRQVKKDQVKSATKVKSARKNKVKKESKSKKAAGPKDAKIPKATNSKTPVKESKSGDGDGQE